MTAVSPQGHRAFRSRMPQEKRNPYAEHGLCWDDFGVRLTMPEHYLMWATLWRASLDRIALCWVSAEDRRSARLFFEDRPEDREWLFSFHSIAEHLDPNGDAEAFKAGFRRFVADALHSKVCGVKAKGGARTVKPQ